MIKVAVMGFGTVGGGVYEIFKNQDFSKKCGDDITVKRILDIRDFENHEAKNLVTKDFNDILADDEIKIVAETMGGLHPAYEFTKDLLKAGKSVVTSNKELVATYGTELLKLAKENNVNYLFEASVGGGIPIIRPLTSCLLANKIKFVAGILNGTTNYILTQMFENGKSFDSALSKAQELGYAERNPAADVEGHDACRKIAILSSLAWGKFVDYKNIITEGITSISINDVEYAEKLDSVIKLIGYAKTDDNGKIMAMVRPMMIKKDAPIANVNDVFNAVYVEGDALGGAMFYGKGAGMMATASAVCADIIDCAKQNGAKPNTMYWEEENKGFMISSIEDVAKFYVRVADYEDDVKKVFPDAKIFREEHETFFVTDSIREKDLQEKMKNFNEVKSVIRLLDI